MAKTGVEAAATAHRGQKRYVFRSMIPRIIIAVSVVMLALSATFAALVFVLFYLASLLHSDSLRTDAWIVLIAGAVVIVGLAVGWVKIAPRHVVGQLHMLKTTAKDAADRCLPEVTRQLKDRRPVDVEQVVPGGGFAPDQFGQVGSAILYLARAAVRGMVDAAQQKHSKVVLVSLLRRNQSLLLRLLAILDGAERSADDPDQLATFFELDYQAVQLRRLTEHSLILAGETVGRQWDEPVAIIDVLRGAMQEAGKGTKDLPRVAAGPALNVWLPGHVAADVTHLLAALIDNGLRYSPPEHQVTVTAHLVAAGCAITIDDRGLGLEPDRLAEFNAQLTAPPAGILAADPQHLGLHVAGLLAHTHHIKLTLRDSPYGGTTAGVVLPHDLLITHNPDRDASGESDSHDLPASYHAPPALDARPDRDSTRPRPRRAVAVEAAYSPSPRLESVNHGGRHIAGHPGDGRVRQVAAMEGTATAPAPIPVQHASLPTASAPRTPASGPARSSGLHRAPEPLPGTERADPPAARTPTSPPQDPGEPHEI